MTMQFSKIPIYQGELSVEGLAEKVQSNSSIAFSAELFSADNVENKSLATTIEKLCVASSDDKDLHPTKSILVSTNWNKNDDVFSPVEVWKARHTPVHKPDNIEHDEKQIVGHMANSWAIDEEGKIIADNTPMEELPNIYHVVNGAVIYIVWEDEDLQKRTAKLIEEIQAGKKFVSMECLFADFDYAITDGSSYKIVGRNESTSWITKHLRCYGGSGLYDGKKVGRLLKNITFCGKGYVNKPANPQSIIFNSAAHVFNFAKAAYIDNLEELGEGENKKNMTSQNVNSGVLSNSQEIDSKNKGEIMPDNANDKINEKLEAEVTELRQKLEAANKTIAEANTSQLSAKVEQMEGEIAELKQAVEAKDADLSTKAEELKDTQTQLTSLGEAKATLEKELEEVRAAELVAKRVAKLVDGGINKEKAEQKVSIFAGLNDEQFDAVADELIEAAKAYDKEDKDKEKKDKEDKEKAAKDKEDKKDDDEDDADANLNVDVDAEADPPLSSSASQNGDEDKKKGAIRKEIATLVKARRNKSTKTQKVEE